MLCPNCEAENPDRNRFCQRCGATLVVSSEALYPSAVEPVSTAAGPYGPRLSPETAQRLEATPDSGLTMTPAGMKRRRIDRLGTRIDGWAELVDDHGDKAEDLFSFVSERLSRREMPKVLDRDEILTLRGLAGERRRYHLTRHQVGSSVALYIGAFGKDLYVAWDMFLRHVWKWQTFAIAFGVALLTSLAASEADRYGFDFGSWLAGTVALSIGILVLVGLAGLVLKRSFWAFFQEEYNHFRTDDVTAMTLAVHHSLLEGLDHIGVDRALIRPKEQFRAGRRERII